MKQRFLLMSFISLLAMLGFVISNVNATGGIAAYYVNPGGTYDAMLDGRVRRIVNNTAYTIFIPSRTLTEQQSFINNLPTGVTMIVDACDFATTVTIDGASYPIQAIGSQCWMKKNLAYLPSVVAGATGSETTPYYYVYGYNGTDVATAKAQANYATYGVLYNYAAALTACPTGWHLPSHDEWTTLERTICTSTTCATDFPYDTSTTGQRGTNEGSKLSTFTKNGNNSSGFTALMSGRRGTAGSFLDVGSYAYFWSSSEGGAGAWSRYLGTGISTVYRYPLSKALGFSVRCLKD